MALAPVLLFTIRFDGGMRVNHAHAAVQTEPESEQQRRELQAFTRLEQRQQRLHIGAASGSTKTLTRRLPRALPLDERCPMVDTLPKATSNTAPRAASARALKSHLTHWCRLEETAGAACGAGGWRVAPDGEE